MRHLLDRVTSGLDAVNVALGRAVSLLVFVMIAVIMHETVARYFFNAPTAWAYDVSGWLQVAYIFLGGAWALRRGYFVRVDILYARFSPRLQVVIDVAVSSVLFVAFVYVMIWKGWSMAIQSFNMNEVSATGGWRGPVWPAKFLVPFGIVLLSVAWLTQLCRQVLDLTRPPSS